MWAGLLSILNHQVLIAPSKSPLHPSDLQLPLSQIVHSMDLNWRFKLSHNYQPNINFEILKIKIDMIGLKFFMRVSPI